MSRYDEVKNAMLRFPAKFGLRGFPSKTFRVSPFACYHNGDCVQIVTQIEHEGKWLDFTRNTTDEVLREVVAIAPAATPVDPLALTEWNKRHNALAQRWAQWNGQRGTDKQIEKIRKQLTMSDLERMLTERGVVIN